MLSEIPLVNSLAPVKTLVGTNSNDKDINVPYSLIKSYIDTAVAAAGGGSTNSKLLITLTSAIPLNLGSYYYTPNGFWDVVEALASSDASYDTINSQILVNTPGIYKVSLSAKMSASGIDGSPVGWQTSKEFNLGTSLPGLPTIPPGMESSRITAKSVVSDSAKNYFQWSDEYFIQVASAGDGFMPRIYWNSYDNPNMHSSFLMLVCVERVN
jgi:hypothetical protein